MRRTAILALVAVALVAGILLYGIGHLVWPVEEPHGQAGEALAKRPSLPGLDDPVGGSAGRALPVLEPEDARARLRGVVVNRLGEAIPGARVWLLVEGSVDQETAASVDGRFSLALDESFAGRASVHATAEGYGQAGQQIEDVSSDASPLIELVLPDALAIRGRVISPPGIGLPLGLQVFGVPAEGDRRVSTKDILRARSGDPRFRAATVENWGEFELAGLAKGEQWLLIAGGRGLASETANLQAIAVPCARKVELEVAPIFVLDVRMVDSVTGGDLFSADRLWAFPGGGYSIPPKLRQHQRGFDAAVLAGLDPGTLEASHDWKRSDRDFFAFESDVVAERIGPVPATLAAPGYDRTKAELWAFAVSEEGYQDQVVELERVVSGFGGIRLHVRGDDEQMALLEELLRKDLVPGLSLKLTTTGEPIGHAIQFSSRLFALPRGTFLLDGVPAGEYEVQLDVGMVRAHAEPREIVVAPDRVTEIELDLSVPAILELQVSVDGNVYEGPLRAGVKNHRSVQPVEGGPWQESFSFSQPPYVIPGVHPGPFKVEVSIFGWQPVVVEGEAVQGRDNVAAVAVEVRVAGR